MILLLLLQLLYNRFVLCFGIINTKLVFSVWSFSGEWYLHFQMVVNCNCTNIVVRYRELFWPHLHF